MFSKSNKKSAINTPAAKPSAPPSIFSSDLKIIGDLQSDGEIQVDGRVNGDIKTRALVVGETAVIKGEIIADSVRVLGRVDGQIKAKVVKLAKTAHVVGDILHEDLAIETGAFLEGHCKRIAMPDEASPQEKASVNKPSEEKKTPSAPAQATPVAAKG